MTTVTLTKPFWMGRTEVTQRQWREVMGSNPSKFKGDNLPVESVPWAQAIAFCQNLTQRERAAGRLPAGYVYTLPTEAQWEYACRAGTTGDYAGNLDAMGWYSRNSGKQTHPVGLKQANAWGLYDMHGNVREWCLDPMDDYPGGSVSDPLDVNPIAMIRRCRGGSYGDAADLCRSRSRSTGWAISPDPTLGFRVALVVNAVSDN